MDEDIVIILAAFLCVFTPIAGLTLRFALKPLVDSVARLLEVRAGASATAGELLEKRVALLEQELGGVRNELQHVTDQRDFLDRLHSGRV